MRGAVLPALSHAQLREAVIYIYIFLGIFPKFRNKNVNFMAKNNGH